MRILLYAGTVRKNMWAAKAASSAIKALYKFMTTKKNMQFENPAINRISRAENIAEVPNP